MRIEISEFSKKLITLILPIAFQQFMLALISASDAVMLGMLRQDALSAVSLAGLCIPKILMHIFTNDKTLIDNGSIYLKRCRCLSF